MVEPIRPSEVKVVIPDFIIQAVNELIEDKWNGEEAVIEQDEILDKVVDTDQDSPTYCTRDKIFKKGWLDFEDLYRKAGWCVVYERPAYYETWDAYFKFTKKQK